MTKPCDCDYYEKSPKLHDRFLEFETLTAPYAATFIVDLLADDDMNVGDEVELIGDGDDFSKFIGQHNWTDPVGMFHLGVAADFAMDQGCWRRMWERRQKLALELKSAS